MVNKIVYTYKFTNLPNIDALKDECKNWLVTILDKFDASKGSKAFSYFSIITKNWFIHQVKKCNQKKKKEIEFSSISSLRGKGELVVYNPYHNLREKKEFWTLLQGEIEKWEKDFVKKNEQKVIHAIKIIISESDSIEIFNKKAIYLYLREITGLNTKQVITCLSKIRVRYKDFKLKWDEGEI